MGMAGYGLGFSHQEINKKCRTVVRMKQREAVIGLEPRVGTGKFKKMGLSVMKKVNAVKRMQDDTEDTVETAGQQPSTIIGGDHNLFN